jgi:O-acetyl-ADP-ribose deacetylase (regulator of RNase III)
MVTSKKGDVLTAKTDIIAHQVNCMGKMGAGLAKQIRDKFPKVYEEYQKYCKQSDILGTCQIVFDDKIIVNLFGQYHYSSHGRQTNYEAIYTALEKCAGIMQDNEFRSIAFPYKMSCGLAGGNWDIILLMIKIIFKNFEVEIWELN